ncbi:uncharacterized protein LOC129295690 [Prosopis cineraria]|uniref:uncharacterized protein LOC129295690 n=1 Tax=Prosopis cineraria TaxID=364024 RepID=UPI00240F0FC9|nr:uncharacterized protein LOC129295690 [Prosopis cineraria]
MEETNSKMWPELIAKAFIDIMAKVQMSEALATRAEANKGEGSKEAASSSSDYSLAKCVIALNEMAYLQEDAYMEALKTLKNDPEWREIFLNMTLYRKRQWVLRVYSGEL